MKRTVQIMLAMSGALMGVACSGGDTELLSSRGLAAEDTAHVMLSDRAEGAAVDADGVSVETASVDDVGTVEKALESAPDEALEASSVTAGCSQAGFQCMAGWWYMILYCGEGVYDLLPVGPACP
jgi:hypothetical protein